MLVLGFIMIAIGLVFILGRKQVLQHIAPANDQWWEIRAIFAGIVALGIGLTIVVIENEEDIEQDITYYLNRSYEESLPRWQEEATYDVQSVPLRGQGNFLDGERVVAFYGLCEDDKFYAYIINYRGYYELPQGTVPSYTTHFAYIPDSTPLECSPAAVTVYDAYPIGDDWYALIVSVGSFQQLIEPTPTFTAEPNS